LIIEEDGRFVAADSHFSHNHRGQLSVSNVEDWRKLAIASHFWEASVFDHRPVPDEVAWTLEVETPQGTRRNTLFAAAWQAKYPALYSALERWRKAQ